MDSLAICGGMTSNGGSPDVMPSGGRWPDA